jgi:ATP-dependent Clp protease adapter protein ClpS
MTPTTRENTWPRYSLITLKHKIYRLSSDNQVLVETFSWSESKANTVMMEAHNTGLSITGEYDKQSATRYCKNLTDRGLVAVTQPLSDTEEE